MVDKIERTLVYTDDDDRRHEIRQDEIATFTQPVVILGDPGLGKTELTRMLGESPGMTYVRAGTFERHADPASLIAEGECIIIDGADEIASAAPGGAVDKVLRKLSEMSCPRFILSCREADWKGDFDQVKINDDYGEAPILLHLQPFSRDDAKAFLAGRFSNSDAEGLLDSLDERGLGDFYGNPLTLKMLGKIMKGDDGLPETKAELFERACHVMLREENPHHHEDSHVKQSTDDLLLAAGAICAAQILCDFDYVHTGSYHMAPVDSFNITDLSGLPLGNLCVDAVQTRLFRAEGKSRFTHIHRAVAEYLGARWLAHCFDGGVSEKHIFSLFHRGEGVPTSLRGLNAWVTHFSNVLAERCINADPYGVLLYGDTKALNSDRARDLLNALKQLSEDDPYFRAEGLDHHSASGLVRTELRDNILAIVETSDGRNHLRLLLLEVIPGTALAKELTETLTHILFDRCRSYAERSLSWKALYSVGALTDQEHVISRLLALDDISSARISCNILADIGTNAFSIEIIVNTVLACLCITENQGKISDVRPIPSDLFNNLDPVRLSEFLDNFSERARCLIGSADHSAQHYTADLVRCLVVRFLESGERVEPARLWSWIDWLYGRWGYRSETRERLVKIFHENHTCRLALIKHVLLTPCATSAWEVGVRLKDTCLDLFPTADDLACVLGSLREHVGCGPIYAETWRGLLKLGRTSNGIPSAVRDAAIETAKGDSQLLLILDKMSKIDSSSREIEEKKHKVHDAEELAELQSHRDFFHEQINNITNGDLEILCRPAIIYLGYKLQIGKHIHLPRYATPKKRLSYYLGNELSRQVLEGFVAVLGHQNPPTAADIVEAYVEAYYEGGCFAFGAPMICGIAEILRRGRAINEIDWNVLAATYMAIKLPPNGSQETDICRELETVLFRCESDWEEHFRTLLEPQMNHNHHDIFGLHRLTDDSRFVNIAGRLAVEWLGRFPEKLSALDLKKLLICAVNKAPVEIVRALIVKSRKAVHPSYNTRLIWLAVDYIIDFDASCAFLNDAAAEIPDFFWFIRDLSVSKGGGGFRSYSLNQVIFIVKAFGRYWQKVELPRNGVAIGNRNPWDAVASEFIEKAIFTIAGYPTPEATEALETLISNHAPSYADIMRHALAQQRRARRNSEYQAPTIKEIQAVMTNDLPETMNQMRTWFEDRINELRKRIRGSNTNMWRAYWKESDQPQDENYCRDRMIEHFPNNFPESIRLEREASAPNETRMDIALICNQIKLPIEIKGQWNKDVWDAPMDQLAAKYAVDYQAEGCGVYIVLWFGDKVNKNKKLKPHPDKLDRPETPEEFEQMLKDRLPEAKRFLIDVYVVDLCPKGGIGQTDSVAGRGASPD